MHKIMMNAVMAIMYALIFVVMASIIMKLF